jgi:hypothetical protein
MRTNGSFDIATATDLNILKMIYIQEYNIKMSSKTTIKVGDDLGAYDPDSHIYNIYTNELGIDINMSKTKKVTDFNICAELVSRNINNGNEVSRISANICRAVIKNPLDLAQLAHHLYERGCKFTIPIKGIFEALKYNTPYQLCLVRALYMLCLVHPREGLELLKTSLEADFEQEIKDDKVLLILNFGIEALKDTYNMYSVKKLLDSIISKMERIMDATVEFDSSEILQSKSLPDVYWEERESIGFLTSKYMLAKSWRSLQAMYGVDAFRNTRDVVDVLEKTDQAMTFKELGVITDNKTVWRPKATKMFNLALCLRLKPKYDKRSSLEYLRYIRDNFSEEQYKELHGLILDREYLEIFRDIQIPVNDPIFTGVTCKVIGQSEIYPV